MSLLCGVPGGAPAARLLREQRKIHHWCQAQLLGQPAASPEVVNVPRHQVVDAHAELKLSDACTRSSACISTAGVGRDGRQVKAARAITALLSHSVSHGWGPAQPLPTNNLSPDKGGGKTQHWATRGTQSVAAAVDGSPGLGPVLGTVDGG